MSDKVRINDIQFINIWKSKDLVPKKQLIEFWQKWRIIKTEKEIENRADQGLFLVIHNNEVKGVSTAVEYDFRQLKNRFFLFRCFIDPTFRVPGLDPKLTLLSRDFLEGLFSKGKTECKGILTVVQSNRLHNRSWAIWPVTKFVYIGDTSNGFPMRVYYFNRAKI